MLEEQKPQEQSAPVPTEARGGGGVRHLAMVVCILLGVFFYAGWRVKSQQGQQEKPQGVMAALHTFYDNVKAGLTGAQDSSEEPVAMVPPAPVQVAQVPAGRATDTASQTGSSQTPSTPVRNDSVPDSGTLLRSTVDTAGGLQPPAELSGGSSFAPGVSNTVAGIPGLEGLALPDDPAAGATTTPSSTMPGNPIGSVSNRETARPVVPGAVGRPATSGHVRDLYERIKNDPVLQEGPAETPPSHTPAGRRTEQARPARSTPPVAGGERTPVSATSGATVRDPEAADATPREEQAAPSRVDLRSPVRQPSREQGTASPRGDAGDSATRAGATSAEDVFIYTVQRQDTLSEIAERFLGARMRAKEVFEANRDQLSRPDQLRVGMRLRIPGAVRADSPLIHVVTASDSLPSLAVRYFGNADTDAIAEIRKANPALLHGGFKPGLRLVIPSKTVTMGRPGSAGNSAQGSGGHKPDVAEYVVKSGDNLRKIAERLYGDGDRWKDIFEANRASLKSANSIRVGQKLSIPQ